MINLNKYNFQVKGNPFISCDAENKKKINNEKKKSINIPFQKIPKLKIENLTEKNNDDTKKQYRTYHFDLLDKDSLRDIDYEFLESIKKKNKIKPSLKKINKSEQRIKNKSPSTTKKKIDLIIPKVKNKKMTPKIRKFKGYTQKDEDKDCIIF